MWQLASGGQPGSVAMHDAPVKELAWIPEVNLLATGSWDKTLRYWDLRQQSLALVQQLPDRCYALAVKHPLMVVGTADRNIIIYNLQNPQREEVLFDQHTFGDLIRAFLDSGLPDEAMRIYDDEQQWGMESEENSNVCLIS